MLKTGSLWEVSDEMVRLPMRTWLEGNVFFGHVSDKDGLRTHHPALGDLDLSFSVHFLAMLRNVFIGTVEILWLCVSEQEEDNLAWDQPCDGGVSHVEPVKNLPEFVSVTVLSECSGCALSVEGC